MSTKIDCLIPVPPSETPQSVAVENFFANLIGISDYMLDTAYINSSTESVYTYRLSSIIEDEHLNDVSSLVSDLNTSLGIPIVCVSYPVTSLP